ncbi:MAG TPA: dTDP-4-dehydrorhamnose 3,5-epimerase family protein [Candidatus Hungatella pullicola]|nr:dTDP-4-dehydrorhamnose 3,5-epimerase family protein [Candidatus Hungatella pullicola]
MKIHLTDIPDIVLLTPELIGDARGWLSEVFNRKKLKDLGIESDFFQQNHSYTKYKGTIRGLHFQKGAYAQAKLVQCVRGSVWNVAVDLRKDSPTFGTYGAAYLSDLGSSKRGTGCQMYLPRGFAHGYLTLEDHTELQWWVDNDYSREHACALRYDSPDIHSSDGKSGIMWDTEKRAGVSMNQSLSFMSEKDKSAPLFFHNL